MNQSKTASIQFSRKELSAIMHLFKSTPAFSIAEDTTSTLETMRNGILFVTPNGMLPKRIPTNVFNVAKHLYGVDSKLFNNTFYDSFSTVYNKSSLELLYDQMLHYFSTYGAESMGIEIPTHLPIKNLNIPETIINKNTIFTVIRIEAYSDIIKRINDFVATVKAPSTTQINYIRLLLKYTTIPDIDKVTSFEVQILLHDYKATMPQNPINFLRYIIYKLTDSTLLIKNKETIEAIKYSREINLKNALEKANLTALASIFFRFKPIFLAFKSHEGCAPIINKIRRLAATYHTPLNPISLQNIVSLANDPSWEQYKYLLDQASNRDLIKLINACLLRLHNEDNENAVYQIRNGKTFVKEYGLPLGKNYRYTTSIMNYAISILQTRFTIYIKGKTFYIPENISYAVPTSEKQFVGNIPYGSSIHIPTCDAFTVGIHWFNTKERTDLDLHMHSETRHFGWNGFYSGYHPDEPIFSGDMTDAPRPFGAAEAYRFAPNPNETYILTVSQYFGSDETEYSLFFSKQKIDTDYNKNKSTFDPNKVLLPPIRLKVGKNNNSTSLGVFNFNKFYFYGGKLSNDIVPQNNFKPFIEGLKYKLSHLLNLETFITAMGGAVTDDPSYKDTCIDLSPEALQTDTLLNIIDCKE